MTDDVTPPDYSVGGGRGTVRPARAREAVRRAIRSAAQRVPDVFAPGARLIVGFSGGQDSTCLLHALANSHRKLDVLAVHIDHALRADSATDAARVAERARAIGVECQVMRVDVPAYHAAMKRTSKQQAARAARYHALASAAAQHAARAVLVAHTADDQAETLLLNLVRGTGLLGLAGMRLEERVDLQRLAPLLTQGSRAHATLRLVRPLLRVSRATTLMYCSQLELPLVEDPSNQTRAYTRNRVRLDLLPLLEQFNPAIREVLARTADLAAEDTAALDALVAERYADLSRDGHVSLAKFQTLPRALQRRVLRFALAALSNELVDVGNAPIEDALDLLKTSQPRQAYHLPYGVELCIGPESFWLRQDGAARQRQQKSWEVKVSRV